MQPTLAGFITFVRNVMGITTTVLPDNSLTLKLALAVAMGLVNPFLKTCPVPQFDGDDVALYGGHPISFFVLAVYNLAGDNVINYGQDLPGAAVVPGSGDPGLPFFAWTRKQLNINGFVSGVVQASADESTSVSMVVQEAAKNFTLANLQQLKTPYGRQYLSIAQSYGESTWGLT